MVTTLLVRMRTNNSTLSRGRHDDDGMREFFRAVKRYKRLPADVVITLVGDDESILARWTTQGYLAGRN